MRAIPAHLGLWWLVPLWGAMAAAAVTALRRSDGGSWRRDGAVLVLCMTGCAIAAFVPPAYFDRSSTTRHMVGTDLATALAFLISAALVSSMLRQAVPKLYAHIR